MRALAAIVSEERTDLPEGGGLPRSLLADLMGQIRCDALALNGLDSGRQMCWFSQDIPRSGDRVSDAERDALDQAFWSNYSGLPLQLLCPHWRSAQRHQDFGLLLG